MTSLFFSSCSKDDDNGSGPTITPTATDINTTIDENAANGSAIGVVVTNLTGTLSYTITSQSVTNAMTINSATGAVTVADRSKFDFEINTSLTANVNVTNAEDTATSTVTVNLNDVDDIASFLTTSKSSYSAASSGSWIPITENEYNILSTALNNTSKIGTSDTQYDDASDILAIGSGGGAVGNNGITMANDNSVTMPTNSYLFAFKYNVTEDNVSSTKVKISSTSVTEGYNNFGSVLPLHNNGDNYFVLKGSNTPTTTNTSYLAIYFLEKMGYKVTSNATKYFYELDDSDMLSIEGGTNNAIILFHGLSTTQKQWD